MRSLTVHRPARQADVDRWARGAVDREPVKENNARIVWRIPAGRPALFVKRFPPSLLRDRARSEARMLRDMAAAGIRVPALVATAQDEKGSYVLTEEVEGARLVDEIIDEGGAPVRPLLAALAELTRSLHDAGFEHLDLHVGNVLVRDGELYVLDVHRARRARELPEARRVRGAAFVAHSFVDRVSRTEVHRFFRRCGVPVREAWAALWERRRRHYRSRDKRCMREGTGFGIRDGVRYRKGTDVDHLITWVGYGEREIVKRDGTEELSRDGERFLKRTKPARALRIWKNSHALKVRGIPTPRLDACGSGWVVGEWIDALSLHYWNEKHTAGLGRRDRDERIRRLAKMVRAMHDRGVYHKDLKAANLLVTDEAFPVVDLDRVRIGRDPTDAERRFNLAQLNASLDARVTRTDRLRFLHVYLGRDRERWKERRRWIDEIMRMTVARKHYWPPTGEGR